MKYKVYLDELNDASRKLVSYSKIDIKNKIDELKNIGESIKWYGPAHDSFINGFNKRIDNLNKLNSKISVFGEYLENSYTNYSETSNKVNNSWEEYITEMKVKK